MPVFLYQSLLTTHLFPLFIPRVVSYNSNNWITKVLKPCFYKLRSTAPTTVMLVDTSFTRYNMAIIPCGSTCKGCAIRKCGSDSPCFHKSIKPRSLRGKKNRRNRTVLVVPTSLINNVLASLIDSDRYAQTHDECAV